VSSLAATASLLIASLDLKEVQLLRGAIRAADAAAGPQHGYIDSDRFCPSDAVQPCSRSEGSPEYLPRPVIHPTPRYLPRPVLHPTVRLEMRRTDQPAPAPIQPPVPRTPNPIQPPWKVLPSPIQPVRLVKVIVFRPEMRVTGRIIDSFI
jgi:hypothetical protein